MVATGCGGGLRGRDRTGVGACPSFRSRRSLRRWWIPELDGAAARSARGRRTAECLTGRVRRLSGLQRRLVGCQLILVRSQLLLGRDQAGLVLSLLGRGTTRFGVSQRGLRGRQRRLGRFQVGLGRRRVDGGQQLPGFDRVSDPDIDGGEGAARIEILAGRRGRGDISGGGHARLDRASLQPSQSGRPSSMPPKTSRRWSRGRRMRPRPPRRPNRYNQSACGASVLSLLALGCGPFHVVG